MKELQTATFIDEAHIFQNNRFITQLCFLVIRTLIMFVLSFFFSSQYSYQLWIF